jgi:hypothetical protein
MIDGCETCSARASCRKAVRARLVALGDAAQDADRNRMPERAVDAAVHVLPRRPGRALPIS